MESRTQSASTTNEELSGFATKFLGKNICTQHSYPIPCYICVAIPCLLRFQVAELVKLPVESAELGASWLSCPRMTSGTFEIPLERGYSKAGLVRYHLEGVKDLTSTKAEESYSEQLSQSKQGAVQKVAGGPKLELENVKAENQLHDKLQAKIQVAESGKGALEKIYSQSQDVCLELHAKLSIDPAFKAKFHEMETMCSNLGDKIKNSEGDRLQGQSSPT